jgi:hypothetical protein
MQQIAPLLDDLVGQQLQRVGHLDAQRSVWSADSKCQITPARFPGLLDGKSTKLDPECLSPAQL